MRRPGVEPTTCWLQVQRPNHYTTEPHKDIKLCYWNRKIYKIHTLHYEFKADKDYYCYLLLLVLVLDFFSGDHSRVHQVTQNFSQARWHSCDPTNSIKSIKWKMKAQLTESIKAKRPWSSTDCQVLSLKCVYSKISKPPTSNWKILPGAGST